MKLEKSKEDKAAESKRNELLKFLNASYDWQPVESGDAWLDDLDLSWCHCLVTCAFGDTKKFFVLFFKVNDWPSVLYIAIFG